MDLVQIHLPVDGTQVPFLSIPRSDIQRLAIRPFKWIRFVMFCVCGTRGDLAATPDGPPVDYDRTSLDAHNQYYYEPSGAPIFVDLNGLNDKITSSKTTKRDPGFRGQVKRRDGGVCVFTRRGAHLCDAAHIIPRYKGTPYLEKVIELRSACYDSVQLPSILDIDSVENGIFLYKPVHVNFASGDFAFLKTPNFMLDSTDIPRIVRGSEGGDHITLHQLQPDYYGPVHLQHLSAEYPSSAIDAGLNVDGLFPNPPPGFPLPPAIILDFMYGAAAFNLWRSEAAYEIADNYFKKQYERIPAPARHQPKDFDEEDGEEARDDPGDEYQPSERSSGHGYSERGDKLASAMDQINLVLMYFNGITPQEAARRQEKRIEEEETIAREASRIKVTEWAKSL